MAMSRMARKATLRALPLWRTICAERSSVSPTACARGPAEKRSTLAALARRRRRQRRAAGAQSLARRQLAAGPLVAHMQPVGRLGRDEPGLAERDRQRAEGDLGWCRRSARRPRCVCAKRSRLRGAGPSSCDLGAQAVIARAVAGALEPVVGGAEVGLAAQVRAALVQRAHVGRLARAVRARRRPGSRRVGSMSWTYVRACGK